MVHNLTTTGVGIAGGVVFCVLLLAYPKVKSPTAQSGVIVGCFMSIAAAIWGAASI